MLHHYRLLLSNKVRRPRPTSQELVGKLNLSEFEIKPITRPPE